MGTKTKNQNESITSLQRKAQRGAVEAQYKLGLAFETEVGITQDFSAAREWYFKAVKAQVTPQNTLWVASAWYQLGMMYAEGRGVEQRYDLSSIYFEMAANHTDIGLRIAQNIESGKINGNAVRFSKSHLYWSAAEEGRHEAIEWLFVHACANDFDACYKIGKLYLSSLMPGGRRDYVNAAVWIRKAACSGHIPAQYMMGVIYDKGLGVKRKPHKALYWYRKAALKGYQSAQHKLVTLCLSDPTLKNHRLEAVRYMPRLARHDRELAYRLGMIYKEGRILRCDLIKAYTWLKVAADRNHEKGKSALATLPDSLLEAQKAREAGRKLRRLQRGANNGDAEAQCNLGYEYAVGEGVPIDYAEAKKWFLLSAAQNDGRAFSNLGHIYEMGHGVKKNYKTAFRLFMKGAKLGDSEAQFGVGRSYDFARGVSQDYKKAVYWYRKAAAQGHSRGQSFLGHMYKNGLGVQRDYNEAYKLFKKAAMKQNTYALVSLGNMYEAGKAVKKSYRKAMQLYKAAANLGDSRAYNNIGYLYNKGLGVRKNLTTAVKWYTLAANSGNPFGQLNLAEKYEKGQGVEKNMSEAVRLYTLSAKQDNEYAQYVLGKLYRDGKGVKQSLSMAKKWFTRAAKQGHIAAKKALDTL